MARSMLEVDDFDAIFGGDATTLDNVSRMDVREGTMGLPVMVTSQYLRFWTDVSVTLSYKAGLMDVFLRPRR